MKILLTILIVGFTRLCSAQDTLYYDPSTANYVIQYVGHFVFVLGIDGTLRPANTDEQLKEGERIVQRDSLVTVLFEPGTKIDPTVSCEITRDPAGAFFVYSYAITNREASKQTLNTFVIELGEVEVTGKTSIAGWRSARPMEVRNGSLAYANCWSWSGSHGHGIPPDSSLGGFALESTGLPAITRAFFHGRAPILAFPDEGPSNYELTKRISELRVVPADYVERRTVAPVTPQVGQPVLSFLDSLISYKHQALTLGWITNQGIANSLDQKLDNAHKQLERGNNKAAKNMLEAFLNEVEAQKDKHLTSEAYALLKYNAEYLISKL